MATIRLYYDKTGKIVQSEHRIDEAYTDENISIDNPEGIKWITVDAKKLGDNCVDDFEITNKKLLKRKEK